MFAYVHMHICRHEPICIYIYIYVHIFLTPSPPPWALGVGRGEGKMLSTTNYKSNVIKRKRKGEQHTKTAEE